MPSKAIVPFAFNDSLVRTVILDNNEPGFIAIDIAKILENPNVSSLVGKLDDDEYLLSKIWMSGQKRDMIVLTESGLYTLLIRSNKPQSKSFRRWVTHEVLPSIRKTGTYSTPARLEASKLFISIINEGKKAGITKSKAVKRAVFAVESETGFDFSDVIDEIPDKSNEWKDKMLQYLKNVLPDGLRPRDMPSTKPFSKLSKQDRDEILSDLEQSGLIAFQEIHNGKPGKPKKAWVSIQ